VSRTPSSDRRDVEFIGEPLWRGGAALREEQEDELAARGVYCTEMHA